MSLKKKQSSAKYDILPKTASKVYI